MYLRKIQAANCLKTSNSLSTSMLCPPYLSGWWRLKCILFIVLLVPSFPLLAQDITPETCLSSLNEDRNQLFQGGFEQAISFIESCIEADAYSTVLDQTRAYELLANVFFAIDDEDQTRSTIARLLEINPTYEPDPGQSRSDYMLLVDEMKLLRPPTTPSISSTDTTDLSVMLSWQHLDNTAVSYTLFRGTFADTLNILTTLTVSDLEDLSGEEGVFSYADTTVSYNTSYFYALASSNANDVNSERSTIVEVQTVPEPILQFAEGDTTRDKRGRVVPRWLVIGGGVVAGGVAVALLVDRPTSTDPPAETGNGELIFPPPIP